MASEAFSEHLISINFLGSIPPHPLVLHAKNPGHGFAASVHFLSHTFMHVVHCQVPISLHQIINNIIVYGGGLSQIDGFLTVLTNMPPDRHKKVLADSHFFRACCIGWFAESLSTIK